jgi:hypothetical protein
VIAHSARAADPVLPANGTDQHLGVVTCAGSTCHGSSRRYENSSVLQNEFVTWHRQDKHARAYRVLLNEESKRIARNLGLDAAEKAGICLDCHADNPPQSARGKRFQISDGVGCEACHGGAQRYLGPHVASDASHAKNVSLGMYPTEDPAARARLCLSCHLGTKDKFATHRIMGAGHPRLSFELDTFSDIQPAHYQRDADYRERKGAWSGTQVWATGQLMAVKLYLDALIDRQEGQQGLFPELAFFDCHGCHRSLKRRTWQPGAGTNLPPGSVRLHDAGMLMLVHIVELLAADRAADFRASVEELHRASTQGMPQLLAAATRLRANVERLEGRVTGHDFSGRDMQALLRSIVREGSLGSRTAYATAEQVAMAIGSLVHAMEVVGALSAAKTDELNAAMDGIYKTLEDGDRYEPESYLTAMKALGNRL